MLASFSRASVATKQISLMRIPCAPSRAAFSCSASSAGFALPVGKARANRPISSSVTEEEIGRFARAFPTGKAKPAELALQLKAALEGAQGIRINEICFVATDARLKDASMAAQIAAASLGGDQEQFRQWLNDPQKLLELIAAAQGSKSGGVPGPGPGGPTPAEGAAGAGDFGAAGLAGGGSGYGGGPADGGTSTGTGPGAGSWTAGGSAGGPVSGTASGAGVGSFGAIGSGLGPGLGA